MILKYKNREIEVDGIHFIDEGYTAAVKSAVYLDTGGNLDDNDVYELEEIFQSELFEAAEDAYESEAKLRYGFRRY